MNEDEKIECRGQSFTLPEIAAGEIQWMPGGLHEINPVGGGIGSPITVLVDRAGAEAIEAQRKAVAARGRSPFVDFNHSDGAAAFRISSFAWKDSPSPGIYCSGTWTAAGKEAVDGQMFREISPVFFVDKKKGTSASNPARIVCRENASPNFAGLVNVPAFGSITPFFAKEGDTDSTGNAAGENQNNNTTANTMNEQELAALQAKLKEYEEKETALKAQQAEAVRKKENTDIINAQIAANQAEIRASQAELANEMQTAKTAALEARILARNTEDADAFIAEMVSRTAIAAKDEKTKAEVRKNLIADPATFKPIYAKWAGANTAVLTGRITHNPDALRASDNRPRIERGQINGKDALSEYFKLVARNSAIRDLFSPEKKEITAEMGALFAAELKGKEDEWGGCSIKEAIKAADVTSASLGTLSGTLVLQRQLPLLKFTYPMLKTLFTDFTDEPGLWNQTAMTRIPITPATGEYDNTNDASGRPLGYVVTTPAQAVDVPVTLSKHFFVSMVFGVQTLASTPRNLFAEQQAGAINALGGAFVDMATALMTQANYNAYAGNSLGAGVTTSGSTAISYTSSAKVYPGQEISGTGIPTGARIASVTSATAAVLTLAATASNTGLTFTLNGGKVPTAYDTYVKAAADFNFASLGEIGAAFDNNRVPYDNRSIMLNSAYYAKLTQDPMVNNFYAAMQAPDMIRKGLLPELNNFTPQKAPWFPTSSSRVGFAYHPASMVLKSRLPQDFSQALNAMVPGSVTTITDPDTGISILNIERVDLVGSYAERIIAVMLGANIGDRRAGLVITSA